MTSLDSRVDPAVAIANEDHAKFTRVTDVRERADTPAHD
jgi:hypothetical protein